MAEKPEMRKNYLKNLKLSHDRNLRVEVVGEVTEKERNFLEGVGYMIGGTIGKNDDQHTVYVAGLLAKVAKDVIDHVRRKRDGGQA
ncbi:MAG: hypothetical protein FD189_1299 [Elusimicrobia bacterium]|nr:MAG: hypothetical protein FD154_1523 [Elusimicrobiota bacterium]KAF0155706.1 MAG: hypothetical protein FD189_1299 [Elusimicrobiota bacterium]